MSQAALSKIIANVEFKFGDKIINRETRPIKATPFGQSLIPYIENCIRDNKELTDFLDNNRKNPSGVVKIYSPSGLQTFLSSKVLLSFHKNHPDIILSMITWNPEDANLYSGIEFHDNCDILISYILPQNQNLVARKLATIEMNIYCRDECFEKHPIYGVEDLKTAPFILLNSLLGKDFKNTINLKNIDSGEIMTETVSGNFITDNVHTAIEFCRRGLSYIICNKHLIVDFPELKPRLPSDLIIPLSIYLIYRKKHIQSLRNQTVIDHIVKAFNEFYRQAESLSVRHQ